MSFIHAYCHLSVVFVHSKLNIDYLESTTFKLRKEEKKSLYPLRKAYIPFGGIVLEHIKYPILLLALIC